MVGLGLLGSYFMVGLGSRAHWVDRVQGSRPRGLLEFYRLGFVGV